MMISVFFAWYDFWVGAYWDRSARVLYVCPLPCVVIRLQMCPRAWPDPFAPTVSPALAWPAWLAFAALVMAVGLVELAIGTAACIVTRARWIIGGALCDVGGNVLPPMPTPQRLASGPPTGACGACGAGVAPECLPGDGALWRVVRAPDGRYAVLSDREPGPVMGGRGGLHGWRELLHGPTWLSFEGACWLAAHHNRKHSTANMGPREAAEGWQG